MVAQSLRKTEWFSEGQDIFLETPDEFNYFHCLDFLNRNPLECLHKVEGNLWRKLIRVNHRLVLIQAEASVNGLKACSINTRLSQPEQELIAAYLVEVFDLQRDLTPFYQSMEEDVIMGPLSQKYFGLRLIGIPELFEALCWCIIGQQINLTFAYKLKRRLVYAKGEKLSFEGCDYFLFPTAETVAEMSPDDFTNWQFSNSKARFLIGIAKAILNGQIGKLELMHMTDDQSLSHLLELTGIGPWSAHYVMMKCLRITAAYPIDDVGLHNAIKASLGNNEKPSRSELERLGGKWHPWQAYATFYLWHSLIK